MSGRLAGRVAIVTGAAQGIGQVYALGLAAEGARVAVADIADPAATVNDIEANGGEALAVQMDVTDRAQTESTVKAVYERFGAIDVLVNNAAIYGTLNPKPFLVLGDEEWDRVMAVNVKGMFLMCQAVVPVMANRGYGKIINISSATALMGVAGSLHYVASKAAVVGLSKGLARELGEANICVNTLTPGFTMSAGSKRILEDHPGLPLAEMALSVQALKRHEEPEDLVGAVVFLASAESDFMTGQVVNVDGGTYMH